MRDLTWNVFAQTGDIEAYLLYKEMDGLGSGGPDGENAPAADTGSREEERGTEEG